jgi:hypothetical protein
MMALELRAEKGLWQSINLRQGRKDTNREIERKAMDAA